MQPKLDVMRLYELQYYDKDILFGMYIYAKSLNDALLVSTNTSFDEFVSIEEIVQTIYTCKEAENNPLNIIMN